MSPGVRAESAPAVVRVGWHESPFNLTDQFGRKKRVGKMER